MVTRDEERSAKGRALADFEAALKESHLPAAVRATAFAMVKGSGDWRTRIYARGVDHLAEETGQSRCTIMRHQALLAVSGWADLTEAASSGGRAGGKGKPATYVLHPPAGPCQIPRCRTCDESSRKLRSEYAKAQPRIKGKWMGSGGARERFENPNATVVMSDLAGGPESGGVRIPDPSEKNQVASCGESHSNLRLDSPESSRKMRQLPLTDVPLTDPLTDIPPLASLGAGRPASRTDRRESGLTGLGEILDDLDAPGGPDDPTVRGMAANGAHPKTITSKINKDRRPV